MKKTAIVYKTIYGSTKKYAQWLAKDFKLRILEMDSVKPSDLAKYKGLIVMSGTYAGSMPLTGFLKKNWDRIKNKDLTIVALGMAPEESLWSKLSYWFVPKRIKKKAKYFKIKGRIPDKGEPIKKANLKRVIDYLKKS